MENDEEKKNQSSWPRSLELNLLTKESCNKRAMERNASEASLHWWSPASQRDCRNAGTVRDNRNRTDHEFVFFKDTLKTDAVNICGLGDAGGSWLSYGDGFRESTTFSLPALAESRLRKEKADPPARRRKELQPRFRLA